MMLDTGLGGGFALASWPGTNGTAANPNPAGPSTAGEAAFGVTAGGEQSMSAEAGLTITVGAAALIFLVAVWWALPK